MIGSKAEIVYAWYDYDGCDINEIVLNIEKGLEFALIYI